MACPCIICSISHDSHMQEFVRCIDQFDDSVMVVSGKGKVWDGVISWGWAPKQGKGRTLPWQRNLWSGGFHLLVVYLCRRCPCCGIFKNLFFFSILFPCFALLLLWIGIKCLRSGQTRQQWCLLMLSPRRRRMSEKKTKMCGSMLIPFFKAIGELAMKNTS